MDAHAILTVLFLPRSNSSTSIKKIMPTISIGIKNVHLCQSHMKLRHGRFGAFLGCTNYPECKGIVNIPKKGEAIIDQQDVPPVLLLIVRDIWWQENPALEKRFILVPLSRMRCDRQ